MNEDTRRPAAIYALRQMKAGRDVTINHTENHFEVGAVSDEALRAGALHDWKRTRMRTGAPSTDSPGLWLTEMNDPFTLEVHEPITATETRVDVEVLPTYVVRAHDDALAEVVQRATVGSSAIAVLLGDSSTGKTRALWEALDTLRGQKGWRLWHPAPSRREELDEQVLRVGPRTVLWLNETQRYFLPASEQDREHLAEQLRAVLADPCRAPVLILGTLWHTHYTSLCADPSSATRKLFGPAVIKVPPKFSGADLDAMHATARGDARLALACDRAEGGQIIQYLAGGPELVHFYETAGETERAVIEAAMDAVRMGHPNVLPFTLLREAATAYLSDATWDCLPDNWFEAALAETSRSCKGARGPITPIRSRAFSSRGTPGRRSRVGGASGEPVYQLADYLDQYSRRVRGETIPPIGFWEAAAAHAHSDQQHTLAYAAWDRGLYRDAAQLWKNANGHGKSHGAHALVTNLRRVFPDDPQAAFWAAAHAPLDDPDTVVDLLFELRIAGYHEQIQALLARDPAVHIPFDDQYGAAGLLRELRKAGANEQIQALLARNPAGFVPLDDPSGVAELLRRLRKVGADTQIETLLARDPAAHITLDMPEGVTELLDEVRTTGADAQASALDERAALAGLSLYDPREMAELLSESRTYGAHDRVQAILARNPGARAPVHDPFAVAVLLEELRESGAPDQIQVLLTRNPAAHTRFDDPYGVAELLFAFREIGADEQANALVEQAITRIPLESPLGLARLLNELRESCTDDQVQALLARNPAAHISLDDLERVAELLGELRKAGADNQAHELAERIAVANLPLHDPRWLARLLDEMRAIGADTQAHALAEHAVTQAPLDRPSDLVPLLNELWRAEAHEQARTLSEHAVAHIPLHRPSELARLLSTLRKAEAHEQIQTLMARNPAAYTPLDAPEEVAELLDEFRKAGADEQIRTLIARNPAAFANLSRTPQVTGLLKELQKAGATEQVAELTIRLPAAGMFDQFLAISPDPQAFRLGRDPDTHAPAERWSWNDLR